MIHLKLFCKDTFQIYVLKVQKKQSSSRTNNFFILCKFNVIESCTYFKYQITIYLIYLTTVNVIELIKKTSIRYYICIM